MAKSFFNSFISSATKAADRAISQVAHERARQVKAVEKERLRQEKQLKKLRNSKVMVNGIWYSRNLLDNPVTEMELTEDKERLQEAREKNRVLEREFRALMKYQNAGNKYEKLGKFDAAIKAYETCVDFGENSPLMQINNYLHSIERLVILYRKKKMYDDEARVLEYALKHKMHPKHEERLVTRLDRATKLLAKNKL